MVDTANSGMDKPNDSPRTEHPPSPLLTENDACAYLKVSKRNLYCWRMAGLVPYFKIGRAVRIRKSEVDAALERMRMGEAHETFTPTPHTAVPPASARSSRLPLGGQAGSRIC